MGSWGRMAVAAIGNRRRSSCPCDFDVSEVHRLAFFENVFFVCARPYVYLTGGASFFRSVFLVVFRGALRVESCVLCQLMLKESADTLTYARFIRLVHLASGWGSVT